MGVRRVDSHSPAIFLQHRIFLLDPVLARVVVSTRKKWAREKRGNHEQLHSISLFPSRAIRRANRLGNDSRGSFAQPFDSIMI